MNKPQAPWSLTRLSIAAAAALLWAGSAQAAAVLTSTSDLSALAPGQAFTVALSTDASTPTFDGFRFSLTYNADVLTYQGGSITDPPFFIKTVPAVPANPSGSTTLEFFIGGQFSDLSGIQSLASLNFTANTLAAISTIATPGRISLLGIEVATFSPDVEAVVTPLPAALPLLATALAGLGLVRARRRRARRRRAA